MIRKKRIEKEICRIQSVDYSTDAFWDAKGKYIYFTETEGGTELWRVPAEGGTPEKVWQIDKRAEMFAIHPSGTQIAFSIRERTTQVKVIEGLVEELDKIYSYLPLRERKNMPNRFIRWLRCYPKF